MSSVNSFIDASSSLARRTPPTRTSTSAIDRARSCYLCEPSLPVRQHASSRRNDDSARPNLGSFFPKPRCARQVDHSRHCPPSKEVLELLATLHEAYEDGHHAARRVALPAHALLPCDVDVIVLGASTSSAACCVERHACGHAGAHDADSATCTGSLH